MTVRTARPCLDCGTPTRNGSRCPRCETDHERARDRIRNQDPNRRRRLSTEWRAIVNKTKAAHIAHRGLVCPGWGDQPAHPVDTAADLTGDHIIPIAEGGTDHPSNCGVLCHPCNSAKGAHV